MDANEVRKVLKYSKEQTERVTTLLLHLHMNVSRYTYIVGDALLQRQRIALDHLSGIGTGDVHANNLVQEIKKRGNQHYHKQYIFTIRHVQYTIPCCFAP